MIILQLFALALTCLSAIGFYYYFVKSERPLGDLIVLFMILISITGGKLIDICGYTTNIGNVFYSTVLLLVALKLQTNTPPDGDRFAIVRKTFISLILINAFLYIVTNVVGIDSEFNTALNVVSNKSAGIMVGSFFAFALSCSAMILLLPRYKYIISMFISEAIDSFVFFAIAFRGQWDALAFGFLLKIAIGLMYYPVYHFTIKSHNK